MRALALGFRRAATLGDDITTVLAECASSGQVDHIGGLLTYVHAPGIVLRCTACAMVMIRIVQTPKRTYVDVRGKRIPPAPAKT